MVSLWHYDCLFIGLFILLLCNWACIRNTDKVAVHISVCAALGLFPACVPLPSVQSAYSVLCSVISFNGVMNKWKKTWMLSTRSWKTRDACSRKKGQTGRPTSACNSSRWRPPGTAHTPGLSSCIYASSLSHPVVQLYAKFVHASHIAGLGNK